MRKKLKKKLLPRNKNNGQKTNRALPPGGDARVSFDPPFPVVAVGASAGGLDAILGLFKKLPPKSGMAFVVIQHSDPHSKCMLQEILSEQTKMPVVNITDNTPLGENTVFIALPGHNVRLNKDKLRVEPTLAHETAHTRIDYFMTSLAEMCPEKAIGIVLSGMGSDGTRGILAIRDAGGITFAQDQKSAKCPEMPRNASAYANYILSPKSIAAKLAGFKDYFKNKHCVEGKDLRDIFELVNKKCGVDFTNYKRTTILRRISRRMLFMNTPDAAAYLKLLHSSPEEPSLLYQDMLIGVTSFFRDKQIFDALKKKILPAVIKKKKKDEPLRLWVAGCSSGEEAYSLGMMILDILGDNYQKGKVQIFATDISEHVLKKARLGFYKKKAVGPIPKEWLERYFIETENGYRVSNILREMCTFVRHNVVKDPPFSRLDMLTCRNMLIYMDQQLQKKALASFRYGLNRSGYLVLGNSESITGLCGDFTAADKKNNIYINEKTGAQLAPEFAFQKDTFSLAPGSNGAGPENPVNNEFDLRKEVDSVINERNTPAAVVVNETLDILQFRGQTGKYLEHASGKASFNLIKMLRHELIPHVHSAVRKAKKLGAAVKTQTVRMKKDGRVCEVSAEVVPLTPSNSKSRYFIIFFNEESAYKESRYHSRRKLQAGETDNSRLEKELYSTREYLQLIINEKEKAVEELKSANEEIQSSNEELRSSNEELETSKEELQSANEEMTTINEELNNRNIELGRSNTDLNNLLTNLSTPVLVLGSKLNIRHFTPASKELFNLIPSDIGRPIKDINLGIHIQNLEGFIRLAIDSLKPQEREVRDNGGKWHLLRVRPYLNKNGKADGAILVFTDINEVKQAHAEVAELAKYPAQNPGPVMRMSKAGKLIYANKASSELLKAWNIKLNDIVPKNIQEMSAKCLENIEQCDYELVYENSAYLLTFTPVEGEGYVNVYGKDITKRKKAEEALQVTRQQNKFLADILESASQPFAIGYPDGRLGLINQAFEKLTGYSKDELLSIDWAEALTPKEWRKPEQAKLEELHKTGLPARYEKEYIRKDGSRVPIELLVHLVKDADGKPLYYYSFLTDITERKRAEEAVRKAMTEYKNLTESINDSFSVVDRELKFTYWNKAAEEVSGFSAGEALGKTVIELVGDNENSRKALNSYGECLKTGRPVYYENGMITKDGRRIIYDVHLSPMENGVSIITRDITQRKLAEETVRKSEEKYRNLFTNMTEEVHFWKLVRDDNGNIKTWALVDANPPTLKTWGRASIDEIRGKTTDEIFGPGAAEHFMPVVTKIFAEETPYFFEDYFPNLDKHFRFTSVPLGEYFITTGADITDIVKAQEAVRASEKSYRDLIDTANSIIIRYAPEGTVRYINDFGLAFFGYTRDEIVGNSVMKLVPDSDSVTGADLTRLSEQVLSDPIKYKYSENQNIKKNGERVWVIWTNKAVKDEQGKLKEILCIGNDITELKKAGAILRESEERFRALAENIPDLITRCDANLRLLYANPAVLKRTGLSIEALIGKTAAEYGTPPEAAALWESAARKVIETGKVTRYEHVNQWQGVMRGFEVHIVPEFGADGKVLSVVAIAHDITERKRAEEVSAFQARLLSEVQDAVFSSDSSYTINYWNQAAEKVFGWTKEEALGKNSGELLKPKVEGSSRDRERANLHDTGHWEGETQYIRKDGTYFFAQVNCTVMRDADGKDTGNLVVARDITERRRAEETLRESEERYRGLFEHLVEGFAYCQMIFENDKPVDWVYISVNDSFETLTGLKGAVGKRVSELIPGIRDTDPGLFEIYSRVSLTGKPERFETYVEALKMWFSISVYSPQKEYFVAIFDVITDRKLAEAALKASEERFRTMAETVPVLISLSTTEDSTIVFTNTAYNEAFGYTKEEIIGTKGPDVYYDPADREKMIEAVKKQGYVNNYELKAKQKDGTPIWLLSSVCPIVYGGKPAILGASIDITEFKRTQSVLNESEKKYHDLFNTMDEGFCIIQMLFDEAGKPVDYRFLEINKAFEKQTGMHNAQGKLMKELAPGHEEHWFQIYGKIAMTGELLHFTNEAKELNRYYDVYAYRVGKPEDRQVGIIFNDVSPQKRVEAALRESEEKFRLLAESTPDLISQFDKDLKLLYANQAFYRMTGLSSEAAIGRTPEEYGASKEAASTWEKAVRTALDTGKAQSLENSSEWQGKPRTFEFHIVPELGADGSVRSIITMGHDITNRKNMEDALREREQRLKFHFENSPLAVVEWDSNYIVTQWSAEAERMFGWKKEETLGRPIANLNMIYVDDIPIVNRTMERLGSGKEPVVVSTNRNYTKAGAVIECVWYNTVMVDKDGKMASIMSLVQDITEKKKAEEILKRDKDTLEKLVIERTKELLDKQVELERARRMADIGRLASTIAHEMRNPLGVIKTAAFNIQRKANNPLLDKHLATINKKILESDQIIQNLLSFTRVSLLHVEAVDVCAIMRDCLATVSPKYAGWQVELKENFECNEGTMEADFTKLHILFSNVLDNAFQSMKSMAGTLTVGIRRQGAEAWEISIADTGTGIDEKDMGKIFEPFYTTKSKGTGLGLAICSEIVYVHGGSIKVHSVKGQGTTFTIILPAKQPASNKDTPQP